MKEKHIAYFDVIESFESDQCPICFLVKNSIEKYIQNLLYENINDVGFRQRFRENEGFCNFHSYKFLKYNDGLAVTLTHKDLLIQKIEKIKIKNINKLKFKKKKEKKCIICEMSESYQRHYLQVISDHFNETEFKNHFLKSASLCIPHLEIVIQRSKNIPDWFVRSHYEYYEKVLNTLNKYLDSCNYSLGDKRPVLDNDEENIWRKIINILFGFEGMSI